MPAAPRTAFDDAIQPRRGWMLVELRRRDKRIAVLGGIIEPVESVPRTAEGVVLGFGEAALTNLGVERPAPGFSEGDLVEFVPHGGVMLPVPAGHPDRMLVPVELALGSWA